MNSNLKSIRQVLPLLAAIVVLLGLFRIWVPQFLGLENIIDLAQQISVNAILAYGMTLVILIGGIDLSVGAVVALIGTVTVAVLAKAGLAIALVAGFGVAALFGAINGLCAARTRMPAFIITLATMLVARGVALRFNEGRPLAVPDSETVFLALGNARLFGFLPVPVLLMITAFTVTAVLLHRTRFGQHLYAIGGNREAARFTGIPLARNEVVVYVICSLLAGLAGIIHASQLYSAEPASGQGFERHRGGCGWRHQFHRRHRHYARHIDRSHHHRHPRQRIKSSWRSLLVAIHRQGIGCARGCLPGCTAAQIMEVLEHTKMGTVQNTPKQRTSHCADCQK
jgi:ribose transport system permease protein